MADNSNLNPNQFNKPKAKRTMSFQYDDAGITFCPSCHKIAKADPQKFGIADQEPTVKYNTDFSVGDLETCSGGCGRTIYGRKGTYE